MGSFYYNLSLMQWMKGGTTEVKEAGGHSPSLLHLWAVKGLHKETPEYQGSQWDSLAPLVSKTGMSAFLGKSPGSCFTSHIHLVICLQSLLENNDSLPSKPCAYSYHRNKLIARLVSNCSCDGNLRGGWQWCPIDCRCLSTFGKLIVLHWMCGEYNSNSCVNLVPISLPMHKKDKTCR